MTTPAGETERTLGLMRLIDRQFLNTPFSGVRHLTWHLRKSRWCRVSLQTVMA